MISRLLRNDFVRHGSFVFSGVAIASLFNYLFYMLIARRAGVEIYGIVTALTSAVLVLSTPGVVAQLVAARLTADLEARGDPGALRSLADLMTAWTTTIAAVIVAVGIVFREPIASFFNLTDSVPVVIAALALGGYTVVAVQRGLLQGAHRFGQFAASSSIDAVVRVLIGVPLVGVLGARGGLIGVAAGVSLAFAYDLYVFRACFGTIRAPIALDRSLIRRVVSHVGFSQLTFTVLTFYDVPLVKHAFDARSAGLYAAVALVGRAVITAVSFIPTLVMPKVAARFADGRSALPLLRSGLGVAGSIVAAAVLAGLAAPRFVVVLISGNAFGDAAPLVLPYIVASSALSFAGVVAAYKTGLHRYDFVRPCFVVAVVEISVLSSWHPTLQTVVGVLVAGHTALLCSTLYRLTAPVTAGRPSDLTERAWTTHG